MSYRLDCFVSLAMTCVCFFFDIIHILKGSSFDGVVERVTDVIIEKLTPVTKEAILRIKYDVPEGVKVSGIEIYQAVFSGGVRNYPDFKEWRKTGSGTGLGWLT